jgi:hypothetical protein
MNSKQMTPEEREKYLALEQRTKDLRRAADFNLVSTLRNYGAPCSTDSIMGFRAAIATVLELINSEESKDQIKPLLKILYDSTTNVIENAESGKESLEDFLKNADDFWKLISKSK